MSFDPKCYDLAFQFLEDETEPCRSGDANALAQAIQDTIEVWLSSWRTETTRPLSVHEQLEKWARQAAKELDHQV